MLPSSLYSLATLVAVVAVLLGCGPRAGTAFKPNEEFGHGFISRAAMQSTGLPFCPETVDNIVEGNLNTDFGREFFKVEAHCDDEQIVECTTRMVQFRNMAIDNFKIALNETDDLATRSGAIFLAWTLIGRALHSMQDFYAHSNWVNLNMTTIHVDVGRRSIDHNPNASDVICQSDRATHVGTVLSTGYFPIGVLQDLCDDEVPNGKCRHGMQVLPLYDCPEGLNKDDPTRPFFPIAQRLAIEATARFLSDIYTLLAVADLQDLYLGACGVSMYYVVEMTPSMQPDIAGIIAFIRNQTQAPDAAQVSRFGLTTFAAAQPTTRSYATAQQFLVALNAFNTTFMNTTSSSSDVCADYLFTALLEAAQDAPRRTEIRVFADSGARDTDIAGLVAATTLSKQQTVRFFLTGACAGAGNSSNSSAGVDDAIGAFAENTGALVIATNKTDVFNSLTLVTTRLSPGAAVIFAAIISTAANLTTNTSVPPVTLANSTVTTTNATTGTPTTNTTNITIVNINTTTVVCVSPALCFCSGLNFTAPPWATNYLFSATFRDRPGMQVNASLVGPTGNVISVSSINFTGVLQSSVPSLPAGLYTYRVCSNLNHLTMSLTGFAHQFPFYVEDFSFSELLGRPGQAVLRPSLTSPVRGDKRNFGVRLRLAAANVLDNNALTNTTVRFLSSNNSVAFVDTPASYFTTGDTQHVLVHINNSIIVPSERFFVLVLGLYRGVPFQVALDTPIVPQTLRVEFKPKADNSLEKLVNLVNDIAGVGNPAPFSTLPLNATSPVSFKVSNAGSSDLTVALTVNAQTTTTSTANGSSFEDFNVTVPTPVSIGAGDSKTVDFYFTPRDGLPHNSSYTLVFAAHNAANPVEANFVKADVQFVGCSNCPQQIGVCEAVNGTYQCNCYLGITSGSCSDVENKLENAAKLLAIGAIIAIVVSAAVCCGLLALIVYCCCIRPRRNAANTSATKKTETMDSAV